MWFCGNHTQCIKYRWAFIGQFINKTIRLSRSLSQANWLSFRQLSRIMCSVFDVRFPISNRIEWNDAESTIEKQKISKDCLVIAKWSSNSSSQTSEFKWLPFTPHVITFLAQHTNSVPICRYNLLIKFTELSWPPLHTQITHNFYL